MKSADVAGRGPPVPGTQIEPAGVEVAGAREAGIRGKDKADASARLAAAGAPRTASGAVDRMVRTPLEAVQWLALRPPAMRVWLVEVPFDHASRVAGYAPWPAAASGAGAVAGSGRAERAGASSKAPDPSRASASGTGGTTSSKGEWAFLDDPRLSIEDKLFQFMKLVLKKSNDQLEQKMKEIGGKKSAPSGSSGSKGSSGSLFGVLKKVFPPLAAVEKLVPSLDDFVNKLASQLGPQLLGALMIPLGAPWAAPLVSKAAADLLPGVVKALAGGSGGASGGSSSTTSSSGLSKENDERLQLMELERMVQKTNQMFATVSNVLKVMHDSAMTAVNNIR